MNDWRQLVKDVRGQCAEVVWGRGIQLSRSATVLPELVSDDEIILKVLTPGKTLANTLTLFLDDDDWHCDCSPRDVACEHLVEADAKREDV